MQPLILILILATVVYGVSGFLLPLTSSHSAITKTSSCTSTLQKFSQQTRYGLNKRRYITTDSISKALGLNGKMILPIKIAAAGLKGHTAAAVYAILDSNYKRG